MLPRVRFSHMKTAMKATWKEVVVFSRYFWLVVIILFGWSKGFASVDKAYSFLIPKLVIVTIGAFFTGIPFLLLIPIAFLPARFVAPIFFVAFILIFTHF